MFDFLAGELRLGGIFGGAALHVLQRGGAKGREVGIIPEGEKGIGFSGVADGRAAPDDVEHRACGHLGGLERSLRPGAIARKQREDKN